MDLHHVQRDVIKKLVETTGARYSDLKPKTLEGNVFTYHLKSLISQKLVQKDRDSLYSLTSEGKLYGINSSQNKKFTLYQAHSIILIYSLIDGLWLVRKRLVQPMFGKYGFIHGEPIAGKTIIEAAKYTLLRRTSLTADFTVIGSGFIHISENNETVSYVNFTMLLAVNLKGEMIEKDVHGENKWVTYSELMSLDLIPSMCDLINAVKNSEMFFLDLSYDVETSK